MQIDRTGKTALVTGSTQGIGLAIALGLARAGARVGVTGRTVEKVAAAAARLGADVPGSDILEVPAATPGGALRVDGGYVDAILP